ncbi:YEATS family protein [Colletotrichum salicis]|uniref:YEATS family protein n=1 Tax=Colletotrichum salicis TaxID=1209931 RepID=A0A135UHM5_9PEZI|nr:YEATS family protein [Colletotrichum salicis]
MNTAYSAYTFDLPSWHTIPLFSFFLLPKYNGDPLATPSPTTVTTPMAPSRNAMARRSNANIEIKRKVRLVTEQNVIDKPSPVEDFPMRKWSINVYIIGEDGEEHPADCFLKVVYNLHPSFDNPTQTFNKPPFRCENEGWGEFDMTIDCYITEKSKQSLSHDLNFAKNRYEAEHTVSFKNPSQALQQILRETGPLPSDDDRLKKKGGAGKKGAQKYDYEKIAQALEKLDEDDLLRVIQIINDNKTAETYIKSDVDGELAPASPGVDLLAAGEFSIDLYTMSDQMTKLLWDYLHMGLHGHCEWAGLDIYDRPLTSQKSKKGLVS